MHIKIKIIVQFLHNAIDMWSVECYNAIEV